MPLSNKLPSNKLKLASGICALFALLALAACDRPRAPGAGALESETETLELRAPGCARPEDCASVTIAREIFTRRAALNEAVRQQLLSQLQGNGEVDAGAESLEQVAQEFIAQAAEVSGISAAHWQLTGEAKRLARRGKLLTVGINTYAYTGGAHGMPVTHWLNWDLEQDSAVELSEVIRPQREKDFWKQARAAHRRWLDEQQADDDFRQNWPFQRSEDFRFDDKGLVLLYGVYTLAPYSFGQVELVVPWGKLGDVIRKSYLPAL